MQRNQRAAIVIALLIVLTAWLLDKQWQFDATATGRNQLLPQTLATLKHFRSTVDAEVFISPGAEQKEAIESLLNQYRSANSLFNYRLTDPAYNPARSRELEISPGGELLISHQNRIQRLTDVSQTSITTALQRLLRNTEQQIWFVQGHGERSPVGQTPADLQQFNSLLRSSGYQTDVINLARSAAPAATAGHTLIIASPIQRYLASEVVALLDYVSSGGNLLWLTEPDIDDGLKALEHELGIRREPGVVIDLAAQQLNIERPDFALVNQYAADATAGFDSTTLFPQAAALSVPQLREWRIEALASTGEQAWTETGSLNGEVKFDENSKEVAGPLQIALALTRQKDQQQQRVVVIGDGDFIADAWLANGGNRDLATRVLDWLGAGHEPLALEYPQAADSHVEIPARSIVAMTILCLIILPGSLLSMAGKVWLTRRYG